MSKQQAPVSAKERVLQAALSCFSAKGYAATTLADIESAAGLTPGCGGTYRHYPSKQAMLEAAVEALLADSETISADGQSLQQTATDALAMLDRNRDARRLLFQDLDQFPELKAKVVDQLIDRSFRLAADTAATYVPNADAEAMAAVMISSLIGFRILEAIGDHPPLHVSDDRFTATWASAFEGLIERALTEETTDAS